MRWWKYIGPILAVAAATAVVVSKKSPRRRRRTSPFARTADASTAEGVLLFYNRATGAVTTGRVDADGNYFDLRNFTGFDRDWNRIVAVGDGLVLFHSNDKMVTARVQADGSLQELRSFVPSKEHASHIVSTGQGIVLFVASVFLGQSGEYDMKVTTGRIDEHGDFMSLEVHNGFDFWSHVVANVGGLVFFYDSRTRNAATTRFGTDGSYQDLKSYTGFDPWTQVVSTSDGLLVFYHSETGVLALGQLDANGNYSDLRFHNFQPGFLLAPTTNGRVMFYRTFFDPGRQAVVGEAVFGRFNAAGEFSSGPLTPLDQWSFIVSVR